MRRRRKRLTIVAFGLAQGSKQLVHNVRSSLVNRLIHKAFNAKTSGRIRLDV
jgi:hypothetical protein